MPGMIPAYYLMFSCVIGLVVLTIFVKNTSGRPLRRSPPAVATEEEIPEILAENEESLWWREERKAIEERIEGKPTRRNQQILTFDTKRSPVFPRGCELY